MIVEYYWKPCGACREYPYRSCFLSRAGRVVQEELFEYLDKVVSVSGLGEGEEKLVLDQSLLLF